METNKTKIVYLIKIFATLLLIMISSLAHAQKLPVDKPLYGLIVDGLEHSDAISIQQVEAKRAAHERSQAWQAYLPSVQLNSRYTHLDAPVELPTEMQSLLLGTQKVLLKEELKMPLNKDLPPQALQQLQPVPVIQEQSTWQANIEAEMLLFSGLQAPNMAKAAGHKKQMYHEMAKGKESAVIKQVIKLYDQLALIQKSFKVLEQTEKRLQEQKRFVNRAVEEGLTIHLDLKRIELAMQKLETRRIDLKTQKELVIQQLAQVTHRDEKSIRSLSPKLQVWEVETGNGNVKKKRPELKAMEEAITAADYQKKAEWSSYIPKVYAFGKRELREKALSTFDPNWYVGVGVRWNLFDGLKGWHEVQKADLQKRKLQFQKQDVHDKLTLYKQKALLHLKKSQQQLSVSSKKVETATETWKLSKKEYRQGIINQKELLDSAIQLEEAQLDYLKAIYKQRSAAVNWYQSKGKLQVSEIQ